MLGIKELKSNRKNKKALINAKAKSTIDLASDPVGQAKKIVNYKKGIDKIMKKVKEFFKWLWYNKLEIGDILFTLLMAFGINYALFNEYIYSRFSVLESQKWIKWLGLLATLIYTFIDVWATISRLGINSLEEIDELIEAKNEKKLKQLPTSTKKLVKEKLSTFENELISNKRKLKDVEKAIVDLESILKLNIGSQEDMTKYTALQNEKSYLDNAIANIEQEITKYQNVLNLE